MNDKIQKAIKLLKESGYQVKRLDEKERMIQHIMEIYDELPPEGKKKVWNYVMMIAFCAKNKSAFERFKHRARMTD